MARDHLASADATVQASFMRFAVLIRGSAPAYSSFLPGGGPGRQHSGKASGSEEDVVARRKIMLVRLAGVLVAGLAASFALAGGCAEAQGNQCAAQCYAQHNQCRMATKGSASCDAQLTACLRGCASRR
jgi:hypothetical protein